MKKLDWLILRLTPHNKVSDFYRNRGVKIGRGCEIYKSVNFGSEPYLITIGEHVRINEGVEFVTHDGGLWVLRSPKSGFSERFHNADYFGSIIVHDNVHIGTDAIIMPGVEIGENCIIGCGAVVTHSIPSNSVVGGVPARLIETLEEYAQKAEKKVILTKALSPAEKKRYLKQLFG